jgi:phosphate transport system permease protein
MNSQGTGIRTIDIVKQGLAKRYRAERRFRLYGLSAIVLSITALALLFISIIGNGYTAFWQTRIRLDITFDPEMLQRDTLASADYEALVRTRFKSCFPRSRAARSAAS